jgi:branched-chain amino acid transport system ATP-binding protein
MLAVERLVAGYAGSQVLGGIDLAVGAGEVVGLLGRNGMGKTTLIRAIMGLLPSQRGGIAAGRVRVDGRDLTGAPPFRVAQAGLGLVPEGRQVFPTLSVRENLVATSRPGAWTQARVEKLFPRLAERATQRAGKLSGGEQQMLAIGRALLTNPRLLILDEATEGLAPLVRAEIFAVLARLKNEGLSILLVDKHLAPVAGLADRCLVIEKGSVAWQGPGTALLADRGLRDELLHV